MVQVAFLSGDQAMPLLVCCCSRLLSLQPVKMSHGSPAASGLLLNPRHQAATPAASCGKHRM